jgi:hypothetical protein
VSEGRSPTRHRYRYRAAIVSACSWSLHLSFCTCAAKSYGLSMDWAPSAAFEHDASDMEQSCSCSSPDMRPPHETPGKIAAVKHWVGACLVAQSSSERHWTASHRTLDSTPRAPQPTSGVEKLHLACGGQQRASFRQPTTRSTPRHMNLGTTRQCHGAKTFYWSTAGILWRRWFCCETALPWNAICASACVVNHWMPAPAERYAIRPITPGISSPLIASY